jgi:hypothetical protein
VCCAPRIGPLQISPRKLGAHHDVGQPLAVDADVVLRELGADLLAGQVVATLQRLDDQ